KLHENKITCARLRPESFSYDVEDESKELSVDLCGAIIWTREPPCMFRFLDLEQWLTAAEVREEAKQIDPGTYHWLCARNAFSVAAAWWHLRVGCDWNIWKSNAAVLLAMEAVAVKMVQSTEAASMLPDCDLYSQLHTDEEKRAFLGCQTADD